MSPDSANPEPRSIRFSYLIGRLDRMVGRAFEAALGAADLSLAQYTALSILARRPGLSNAQLARRALVSPQAMNQALAGLVERRLVERSPHPTKGRVLQIALTARGERTLRDLDMVIDEVEADLLDSLDDAERHEIRRLLAVVADLAPRQTGPTPGPVSRSPSAVPDRE